MVSVGRRRQTVALELGHRKRRVATNGEGEASFNQDVDPAVAEALSTGHPGHSRAASSMHDSDTHIVYRSVSRPSVSGDNMSTEVPLGPSADEVKTSLARLNKALGSRYEIPDSKPLGTGGAGLAFLVLDRASRAKRVAKILRPSAKRAEGLEVAFRDEAKKLAALRHPNLVGVFEQAPTHASHPYFVMEFVPGGPFHEALRDLARKHPRGEWVRDVVTAFQQLADALAYLHSPRPPLLHLDLKPDNIMLSRDYRGRPLPVLLDFGVARFAPPGADLAKTRVFGTFAMWPTKYLNRLERMTTPERTVFLIDRANLSPELDLHLLGRTIEIVLEGGLAADTTPKAEWKAGPKILLQFLRETIASLDIDNSAEPKHESASSLRDALERLVRTASRARSKMQDGVVRIPGYTVFNFGTEVRLLTDWARFQRLRGIHQLGFTHLVYPGATHTRFEHSLGVFENALQVLDHIAGPSGDYRFRSNVSDEELVATALVALFHDIGHYPFAHQFRLSGEFPRHEERSLKIIESDVFARRVRAAFNNDVHQAMRTIMGAVVTFEDPRTQKVDAAVLPAHYRVLRAVVSSSIDVDKLDYVRRDAHHAGVPYGLIVDQERFLMALRVWWDAEGGPVLLLSDKGRVCAEALVFARYLMTSEVYWNHAVRAYAAMLSAAISLVDEREVRKHSWDTDEQFLTWLGSERRTVWLTEAIAQRRPYRRAFVHQRLGGRDAYSEADARLFDLLEKGARGDAYVLKTIRETLPIVLDTKGAKDHEIVLDVPAGMTRVGGVQVLPEGHEEPGRVGPIFDAIGENFDGFARKARVFVHPRLMAGRTVAESTRGVRKALMTAFAIG